MRRITVLMLTIFLSMIPIQGMTEMNWTGIVRRNIEAERECPKLISEGRLNPVTDFAVYRGGRREFLRYRQDMLAVFWGEEKKEILPGLQDRDPGADSRENVFTTPKGKTEFLAASISAPFHARHLESSIPLVGLSGRNFTLLQFIFPQTLCQLLQARTTLLTMTGTPIARVSFIFDHPDLGPVTDFGAVEVYGKDVVSKFDMKSRMEKYRMDPITTNLVRFEREKKQYAAWKLIVVPHGGEEAVPGMRKALLLAQDVEYVIEAQPLFLPLFSAVEIRIFAVKNDVSTFFGDALPIVGMREPFTLVITSRIFDREVRKDGRAIEGYTLDIDPEIIWNAYSELSERGVSRLQSPLITRREEREKTSHGERIWKNAEVKFMLQIRQATTLPFVPLVLRSRTDQDDVRQISIPPFRIEVVKTSDNSLWPIPSLTQQIMQKVRMPLSVSPEKKEGRLEHTARFMQENGKRILSTDFMKNHWRESLFWIGIGIVACAALLGGAILVMWIVRIGKAFLQWGVSEEKSSVEQFMRELRDLEMTDEKLRVTCGTLGHIARELTLLFYPPQGGSFINVSGSKTKDFIHHLRVDDVFEMSHDALRDTLRDYLRFPNGKERQRILASIMMLIQYQYHTASPDKKDMQLIQNAMTIFLRGCAKRDYAEVVIS